MKPRHFHLLAVVLLTIAAGTATYKGSFVSGAFLGLGAIVALIHWKASKAGLTDDLNGDQTAKANTQGPGRGQLGVTAVELLMIPVFLALVLLAGGVHARFFDDTEISAEDYTWLQTSVAGSCEARRYLQETVSKGPVQQRNLTSLAHSLDELVRKTSAKQARAAIIGSPTTCDLT